MSCRSPPLQIDRILSGLWTTFGQPGPTLSDHRTSSGNSSSELKVQLADREAQLAQMEKEAKDEAEALAAAQSASNTKAAELRVQAQKLLDEAAKLEKPNGSEWRRSTLIAIAHG